MEIDSEEDIPASSRLSLKTKERQPASSSMQFSDMSDLSDIDTDFAPEPSRSPPANRGAFRAALSKGRRKHNVIADEKDEDETEPKTDLEKDLIKLIGYLKENNVKYKILGGGANLIFENDYDGVLIKLDHFDKLVIDDTKIITQLNRIEKGMRDKQLLNEE